MKALRHALHSVTPVVWTTDVTSCLQAALWRRSALARRGASTSSEELWRERRPAREKLVSARRSDSLAYCVVPSGSAGYCAPGSASLTEPMKVSSPERPLNFATASAAGSGASSSEDDGS
ncbi:hypothetical protein PR202_gb11909 [Eleusine coracana subsp. coracana]|uniref:Secreted protein n=1 Tax=Eleusine coracana subsp. coracana TaxID=191504 RepID=A0AAV5EP54_ELECO|nr:hypothetical protein PR202_gb11899 [Eleusine coracana subsp. coracana]GJN24181.1 hypothetical protein PR202_gb11909 [Eleusine coracana subsp. coracana]